MEKILNYINGELVAPTNGNYLDNYNPSNGDMDNYPHLMAPNLYRGKPS